MQLPRLFRRPLVHFLLLGGLLFLAQGWLPRAADTIRVSAADVERLRQDWRRDTGHAPSDVQLQASYRRWLEDEALLREALRLGLDQRDAVARRRLLMNLRFAFPETALDDASLLREAEALEMQQSDLVARRRLIQAMEQRLLGELQWSEQELRDYVAAHPERYAGAVRYRFRQVFLAPERMPQEAQSLLAALRAGQADATGDAFLLGERFNALAPDEITRQFGPALAQALVAAKPGEWSGPVASPYGNHLLLLERREAAATIDYASVRRQAAYALLAEREAQRLAQARARLLRQYRVEPGPGVPETVS
ncbi:peptidyl-prolyl cis-trans isomerase [Solimonas sp. K1W22B-7]|uniref:peptidyl-prolyl cis-trans isomerase n=1 Tax=Solimonas sp. K1W22B-7 TaxID=2303331 RepID=UPI000E336E36|nr:peptidyl-prolyl cis-trans isomerase [Solimonas sp. K1W22B-7]AXQ28301.1 peptidyl-prolyl cis-trans isomerase [Solimonas sp. K1W22B-7]